MAFPLFFKKCGVQDLGIRILIMLDPDPDKLNADMQHWISLLSYMAIFEVKLTNFCPGLIPRSLVSRIVLISATLFISRISDNAAAALICRTVPPAQSRFCRTVPPARPTDVNEMRRTGTALGLHKAQAGRNVIFNCRKSNQEGCSLKPWQSDILDSI